MLWRPITTRPTTVPAWSIANQRHKAMVPLYAARIEDLGPGDFVRVQCIACGHDELLTADQLRVKGLALPPHMPLLDLEPRLRCRECDAKGKVIVSVKWAK